MKKIGIGLAVILASVGVWAGSVFNWKPIVTVSWKAVASTSTYAYTNNLGQSVVLQSVWVSGAGLTNGSAISLSYSSGLYTNVLPVVVEAALPTALGTMYVLFNEQVVMDPTGVLNISVTSASSSSSTNLMSAEIFALTP